MESGNPPNVDVSKFVPKEWKLSKHAMDLHCADHALLKMLEEGLHTDITLVAQGGSVKAHRSVLASVSPVFCAMFQHNLKEQLTSIVDIPDMTIDGLQLFLLVLYTNNEIKFVRSETMPFLDRVASDKHFAEFWRAAHKYQVVTRLQCVLCRALEMNLTPDNCWDYLNGALQESRTTLVCCQYICSNYNDVIDSESFLQEIKCNPQQVQSILKMVKQIKSSNW